MVTILTALYMYTLFLVHTSTVIHIINWLNAGTCYDEEQMKDMEEAHFIALHNPDYFSTDIGYATSRD